MREVLNIAVLVFAVSSMLSVGLAHEWREILAPLRAVRPVLRALVANFVLVPLLAFVVLKVLVLERPLEIALFLVACAAGAPFLIKIAQVARTDVALGTTLLIVLLPATVVYLPIVVPLALPAAEVNPLAIAMPLVLTMLLPLTLGLVARANWAGFAKRLQPLMGSLSTIALVIVVVATFVTSLTAILPIFRTSAILGAIIVLAGAFAIGYAIGGPGHASREVLALGTAQRNIAAATVVATQAVNDPGTTSMVVTMSLLGLAMLFPVATLLRRRRQTARPVS